MDQIYEIAFRYYVHFYSYKGRLKDLKSWVTMSLVMGALFVFFFVLDIHNLREIKPRGFSIFGEIWRTIYFEIVFLICFFSLQGERDNLVIGRRSEKREIIDILKRIKHGKIGRKLVLAKRDWLKINVQKSQYEFLEFAKEIREIQELHKNSIGQQSSFLNQMISFIYSSSAKGRIISLLIFLLSLLALLSFKSVEGIDVIFSVLGDSSFRKLMIVLMFLVGTSFFLLVGFIYLIKFLVSWFSAFFATYTSSKNSSYHFIGIFVRDLVTLYRLPKLKSKAKKTIIKEKLRMSRLEF